MEQRIWDLSRLYTTWRDEASLEIAFQPLIHIPSGRPFAYEALSRPKLNSIPVPIGLLLESAARVHQLSDFDRFALPAILTTAAKQNFPKTCKLFINISPLTLLNPDFILACFGNIPTLKITQIVLEISEREALPDLDLDTLLAPYRSRGMLIALDDYGAGYSGLNRLVMLQPDYAKIDLSLVRDIDKNAVKHALVESTVMFAGRSGHMQLLAEGIETAAELATLHELGIALGQGYLLGHPSPTLETIPHDVPLQLLERRVPDATEQLQAFLTTSHHLMEGIGSGEGIATHIVHLASRLLAADIAGIWRPQKDDLYLEYSLPPLPDDVQRLDFNPASPGFHAMASRSTVAFQTAEECQASPIASLLGVHSIMLVPIYDGHRSQGLLVVGYHNALQIRPQEIKIAEGLARLMALGSITNIMSDSDRANLGEPIFEAIASLVVTSDLDSLLAKVMEAALSVSGGHLGYIGILTPDSLHAVTATKESFEFNRKDLFDAATRDGQSPVGQVLREQRMVCIQDIVSEPSLNPWRQEMLADGVQAALGLPLRTDGDLLGILKVYHSRKNGFEPARIRRLQALASLATAVIQKWSEEHQQQRAWLREKSDIVSQLLPQLTQVSTARQSYELIRDAIQNLVDGTTSGIVRLHGEFASLPRGTVIPHSILPALKVTIKRAEAQKHAVCEFHPALRKTLFVLPLLFGGQAIGAIWADTPIEEPERHEQVVEFLRPHLLSLSLTAAANILFEQYGF